MTLASIHHLATIAADTMRQREWGRKFGLRGCPAVFGREDFCKKRKWVYGRSRSKDVQAVGWVDGSWWWLGLVKAEEAQPLVGWSKLGQTEQVEQNGTTIAGHRDRRLGSCYLKRSRASFCVGILEM